MQVANLTQQEYKTFQRKVAILKKHGISLKYDVAGKNKRNVKITMHTPVEVEKWDAICGEVS